MTSWKTQLVPLGDIATISPGLVTSGAGAGAREGSWVVREVSLKDIQGDRIVQHDLDSISIEFKAATEKHLLRPFDVLLTARSTTVKAALVPPALSRAVANSTLAVVRPRDPDLGPFLWWFFTSRYGRTQIESRMVGSTVMLLRAGALRDVVIPLPPLQDLRLLVQLIETSERAYEAAVQAASIRHEVVRDRIIEDLVSMSSRPGPGDIGPIQRVIRVPEPFKATDYRLTNRETTTVINGDADATH